MKKSQLRKIIKQTIKEQFGDIFGFGGDNNPPNPTGGPGFQKPTVSAKGCCKELHILQRLIQVKQQEIQELQNSIPLFDLPFLYDIFGGSNDMNEELAQAQSMLDNYTTAINNLQATGCCKGNKF